MVRKGLEEDRGRVPFAAAPAGAHVEQLRTGHPDEKYRSVPRPVGDMLDQVEERRLCPVEVIEDDDERPPSGQRLEELSHPPKALLG